MYVTTVSDTTCHLDGFVNRIPPKQPQTTPSNEKYVFTYASPLLCQLIGRCSCLRDVVKVHCLGKENECSLVRD